MEENKEVETITNEEQQTVQSVEPNNNDKKGNNKKLITIILIIAAGLCVVFAVVFFVFFNHSDKEDEDYNDEPEVVEKEDEDKKVEKSELVCKRATKLHTATCTEWIMPDNYTASTVPIVGCSEHGYYDFGETITYGNLGTKGKYNVGDAFDCDVNSDGVFDDEKERFYLLRKYDKYKGSSYLTFTLIYSSNVSNGEPNNNQYYLYNENISDTEYLGPQTAIKQLPNSSQWTNKWLDFFTYEHLTTLIKSTHDTGVIINYGDKKARLLKAEDMDQCLDDSRIVKKNCAFLFENTTYSNINLDIATGYWMENVYYSVRDDYSFAYALTAGGGQNIWDQVVNNSNMHFGVRPVIEISELRIED